MVSLFLHLERGIGIDEFLLDFPSVKKEQCYAAVELAGIEFIKLYYPLMLKLRHQKFQQFIDAVFFTAALGPDLNGWI